MENHFDVFISYSHKDSKIAKEIHDALSNANISCFFDDVSIENPDFWPILVNGIKNCKIFLFLGSENTAKAKITSKELSFAIECKESSSIYPYFIDDYELPDVHKLLLADINHRYMSKHPIDTGLVPDLKRMLELPWNPPQLPPPLDSDVLDVEIGKQVVRMIRVKGGTLQIGATIEQGNVAESDEYPPHTISLPTFYISEFPITQNLWEFIMGYNKSHFKEKEKKLEKENNKHTLTIPRKNEVLSMTIGLAMHKVKEKTKTWAKNKISELLSYNVIGHYPAENLSQVEAQEFVRRLSNMTNIKFSLPTEDEWEYAARGGQSSKGYKYAGSNDIDEVAWYRNNADGSTHPVGEKKPNELGLYDMSGNVWEWTETPSHSYATDIETGGNIYIRRGGSWWHEAKNCRVSRRYASDHTKKTSGLGLRVVIRENVEQ